MEQNKHMSWIVCLLILLRISTASIAESTAKIIDIKNITAVAGRDKRLTLRCPYFKSIPVLWRKNGKVVHQSKSTHVSLGSLTITTVSLAVEGQYECSFHDLDGNRYMAIFNVTVNETPRISQRSRKHLYTNGTTAVLDCQANGKPKPEVFWINGRGCSPISPPTITLIGKTSLRIKGLKERDSKLFICVAQNEHGRAKVMFRIDPVYKAQVNASNLRKKELKFEGRKVKKIGKYEERKVKKIGKYEERKVKKIDQYEKRKVKKIGEYEERKVKKIDQNEERKVKKIDKYEERKVKKIGESPKFLTYPGRIMYVKLGQKVKIHCSAKGYPQPKMIITKMRPFKFTLQKNVIPRARLKDIGLYECKAVNNFGTIKYPFLIRLKGGMKARYQFNRRKVYRPHANAFTNWSSWSSCSNQCGTGIQTRTRKCKVKVLRFISKLCKGLTILRRMCFRRNCRRETF